MQQDPSWRRIHPQVRSAAVLGLVLKPYAAVQLFVPVVATVSLHVFQLKLFVDSHFTDWSFFASAALVLP